MGKNASFELEEKEAKLAALRAALDEGEAGGAATAFDFEAFIAEKRHVGENGSSMGRLSSMVLAEAG